MKKQILQGAKILGGKIRKNSPLILTIGTVLGVGTVIFTTAKSTIKAKEDIDNLKFDAEEDGREITKKDVAKILVKDCWPVAVAAGATVTMTIGNHRINSERIKTATVAYEFYREAYETYREKVREKLGEPEERKIEAERVKGKVVGIDPELVPQVGYGNVLFIEGVTGQAFRSSVDYIRQCEKRFNQELKGSDWECFNNWLIILGLRTMDGAVGDYLGFSERFDYDGLNVTLTPSNEVFGTGETATVLTYDDPLCTEGDFRVLNW